jgi:hypothetical protein
MIGRERLRFCYCIGVICLTVLFLPKEGFGQGNPFGDVPTNPGDVPVTTIRVVQSRANSDFEDDTDENEYTFKFWYPGLAGKPGNSNGDCSVHNSVHPGTFGENRPFVTSVNPYIISLIANPVQTLEIEAWEDDSAPDCAFNGNDEAHGLGSKQFGFFDLMPIRRDTVDLAAQDIKTGKFFFFARVEVQMGVPLPDHPKLINADPSAKFCGDIIRLRTEAFFNPAYIGSAGWSADWQYQVGGTSTWKSLGTSGYFVNGAVAATPISEFEFNVRNLPEYANLATSTDISFRVSTRMSFGSSFSSGFMPGLAMSIDPAAPRILSTVASPTCPGGTSGKIAVSVSGISNYAWVVRAGGDTSPCDPSKHNCGGFTDGTSTANDFDITGLPAGKYGILIANGGGTAGACFSPVVVDVAEIPTLQFQTPAITSATCPGSSDGAVNLSSTGGLLPFVFGLTKDGNPVDGTDGKFSNLAAGDYAASVSDGCNQGTTSVVTIPEPKTIVATLTPIQLRCTSPVDGSIQVNITQGEGTYNFQLLKEGNVIDQLTNATVDTWKPGNLSDGAYSVKIIDAQRAQCAPSIFSTDVIAPKPMSIARTDITQVDLTCFEQNDGSITLTNSDATGGLIYTINGQLTGTVKSVTTTAVFQNLPADKYSLTIKQNGITCDDLFSYADLIEVKQPDELTVALTPIDVSCADRNDGRVESLIGGADATDVFKWEKNINGSWSTLSFTTSSLTNISGGDYRVSISNSHNCHVQSDVITVVEPKVLAYSRVDVADIQCANTSGTVEAILSGGTMPFTYNFSRQGGDIQSSTTSITNLSPGVYSLTTTDKNGCEADYQGEIVITAPSSALTARYILTDYNGFQISCKGASNGIIDIIPSGGNGGNYAGYSYAMDDEEFKSTSRIRNIGPGDHVFHVVDGRGCLFDINKNFIEPAAELKIDFLDKNEVKCQNDADGFLSVNAEGGSAPYTYTINGVRTQSTGSFTNLPGGDYNILVSDVNGCSSTYLDHIGVLNPPIEIAVLKTDASCFGLSDGVINSEISGGAAPLTQQWSDGISTFTNTDALPAGTYNLVVTDSEGCIDQKMITISQPPDIAADITTIAVCTGKTTGEIHVIASGGAGSYTYSADGLAFQSEPIIKGIGAGSYDVVVKDITGCEHIQNAVIATRTDHPKPDFLVASKQNALDTLVVDEISIPKPDSVEWMFDPAIIVVKQDSWAPEIKVNEAGTYTIAMKGYFGGCDYTTQLSININPYDPGVISRSLDVPFTAIKSMTVTPNPNAGDFTVTVELNYKQRLSLNVIDITGVTQYEESWEETESLNKQIHLNVTLTGVYIVRAITESDAQEVRIVINK